jgi:hypothetical protein
VGVVLMFKTKTVAYARMEVEQLAIAINRMENDGWEVKFVVDQKSNGYTNGWLVVYKRPAG